MANVNAGTIGWRGTLTANEVTSQTAQAVTFSFKAGVAVGIGTVFNVVGLRFG